MGMKTPDEIKKGLFVCSDFEGNCPYCPYAVNGHRDPEGMCVKQLANDADRLTQRLEAQNAEQAERIRVLERRNNALYHTILGVMHFVDKWLDVPAYDPDEDLNGTTAIGRTAQAREEALYAIEQLEAERDAAVAELKGNRICQKCKHFDIGWNEPCLHCDGENNCFEWRSVQKEE